MTVAKLKRRCVHVWQYDTVVSNEAPTLTRNSKTLNENVVSSYTYIVWMQIGLLDLLYLMNMNKNMAVYSSIIY